MSVAPGKRSPRARAFGREIGVLAGIALCCLLAWLAPTRADREERFGPYGPEGPRLREQLWIVPSGDEARVLRATVFRPAEDAAYGAAIRRPLAVINHGTSDDTRLSVSMPVFYWLSRWFVERGYVVVLPQRRGHGATGGVLAEVIGTCADPDHITSGQIAADDIEAVITYMSRQPGIAPDKTIVVGVSTGGWASLALASRNPEGVQAVVNFAGGRGGHAGGRPNSVCGESKLAEAAGAYGSTARVPTIWLYAKNDSYFGPRLARSMSQAWLRAGGSAELHVLPPHGAEGHGLADDRSGLDVWGPVVDRFLNTIAAPRIASGDGGSSRGSSAPRVLPKPLAEMVQPASLGAR
jgi:dienelactone hydrolase